MPNDRRFGGITKDKHYRTETLDAFWQGTHRAANAARAVMAEKPLEVTIRTITPGDISYVIDSWCDTYRRSPDSRETDPELFKVEQRARIARLLPRSKQLIACDKTMPHLIYGWVCFEPPGLTRVPIVHYMCVKPHAQMKGLGAEMLKIVRSTANETTPLYITHRHFICKRSRMRKYNLIYNNYLLELI